MFSLQIYNINRILKKILSNICTISIEGALQILPSPHKYSIWKRFKVWKNYDQEPSIWLLIRGILNSNTIW